MDGDERSHVHSVLVVADHADMRDAYATMLQFEAIQVTTAWGPGPAVDAVKAGARPCVTFVDLDPIDALGLVQQIQAVTATVPLVFLQDARGYRPILGFSGILRQPVDTEILSAAVQRYCAN